MEVRLHDDEGVPLLKYGFFEWISRAHFISIPKYIVPDFKTFSFYWWKEAVPTSIKYYFSVNISNILKYVTI